MCTQSTTSSFDSRLQRITPDALGFYPMHFIHHCLPYRKTVEVAVEKVNGHQSIIFSAGTYKDPDGQIVTSLPYGKYARLGLQYLCTQAKKTGSSRIDLATSLRGFMREVGLPWDAKEAREVLRQVRALLAMQLVLTQTANVEGEETQLESLRIAIGDSESLTFLASGDLSEGGSQLVLSQAFYEQVVAPFAVPLDTEHWGELVKATKSPLALDIYLWASNRLYGHRGVSRVSWEQLYEQFGSGASLHKFREQFRRALGVVVEHFPVVGEHVQESGAGAGVKGFKGLVLTGSLNTLESAT